MREELKEQTSMGHISILPWVEVLDLTGLWKNPLVLITKEVRCPWLIYDYMWSGLNAAVLRQAPTDVMQFTQTLLRLLHTILHVKN